MGQTSEADQMHYVSGKQMLGHREHPRQIRRADEAFIVTFGGEAE